MMLPSFQCSSKRNYRGTYFLSDRAKNIWDMLRSPGPTIHSWFFRDAVHYDFNSRGYRDIEWPQHDLDQYYWCLGDSLTLGLGMPFDQTWPQTLQRTLNRRCINVSMAGASNQWIFRKCRDLLGYVQPKHICILWTWLHRREKSLLQVYEERWKNFYNNVKDPTWPQNVRWTEVDKLPAAILKELHASTYWPSMDIDLADESRLCFDNVVNDREDVDLIVNMVQELENQRGSCRLHHMFLPAAGGGLHQELAIRIEAATHQRFKEVKWVDHSRDYDHLGRKSVQNVAAAFAASVIGVC